MPQLYCNFTRRISVVNRGRVGCCHVDIGLVAILRIVHFHVANHSGVPDLAVDVRDHLVLVGPNDAGKSSLLRLLDAVMAAAPARLYALLTVEHLRDPELPLVVELSLIGPDEAQKAAFADELEAVDGDHRLRLRLEAHIDAATSELAIERRFTKPGIAVHASAAKLAHLGWTYLPSSRSPDRELGNGRASALRELLGGVDLEESLPDIQAAIAQLHGVIAGVPSLVAVRDELAIALDDLLPRPVGVDDVQLRLPSADETDPLADIDVQLRDGDRSRSLRRQSDGTRAMSTVALQLLTRATAKIIAVDEPETHLHPLAQRRIGRMLRTGRQQSIVATHSSSVLVQFDPMDVIALAGRGHRQLSQAPFAKDPQAVSDWWTSPALEPLTASAVILVEGKTDAIVVESVARLLGHDLDRLAIAVGQVDGSGGFKMALRLFGPDGFAIPYAGLVDQAETSDVAGYLDIDEVDLEDRNFFICDADLEAECVRSLGPERHAELLCESGYFHRARITSANGVEELADLDEADYAAWCRKSKNKALVATALAGMLTAEDAARLIPVVATVETAVKTVQL